jgi:2-keto-4-pentenoate hydratase/2-oxohepta-3-ene-1,7-dioic acid hydratase in catechol pathway
LKNDYQFIGDERISLSVNDDVRQDSSLSKMIFSPVEIVKYNSSKMKLEKGDLIFTGTPAGVGKVNRGEKIKAEIENIGTINSEVI